MELFGLTKEQRRIIVIILLTVLIASLDQTIVATAMPTIITDLGGLESMGLVFGAYMAASIITITISGKLGDIFGRKKLYIAGILLFTIGSFLCGFSENMTMLIAFRAMQGFGAGIFMVLSMAMMGDLFPPRERGKWISLIAAVYGIASIFGPILGAVITESFGWRWVFYVNVPIGIFTMWLFNKTPYKQKLLGKSNIDFLGCILFAIFAVSFMSYTEMGLWPLSSKMIAVIGIMLISLFLFIRQEHKAPEAILPSYLFKNQIFILSSICCCILSVALFGIIAFVPQYVQIILGGGAMDAGKALTPLMLSAVISAIAVGQITSRTGKYKLIGIIATILVCIGVYLLANIGEGASYNEILIALSILGIGLGPQNYIYTLMVQNAFDNTKVGVATSGITFFRNFGAAFGVSMMGAIINLSGGVTVILTDADKLSYIHGLQTSFLFCLILSIFCVFLFLKIKEIPLRTTNKKEVNLA
ncbi:MAG: MDR family MFS transporter [Candidatus Micrarchaeia archaeon]